MYPILDWEVILSYMRCKHKSRSMSALPKTELKTWWELLLLLLFLTSYPYCLARAGHTLSPQKMATISLLLLTLYLNLHSLGPGTQ